MEVLTCESAPVPISQDEFPHYSRNTNQSQSHKQLGDYTNLSLDLFHPTLQTMNWVPKNSNRMRKQFCVYSKRNIPFDPKPNYQIDYRAASQSGSK